MTADNGDNPGRYERARSPDAFADALLSSVRRFTGNDSLPHDDVTLVVINVE
jgi:serine phosphatase RsbU (regulator of sigma subunit)